MSEIEPIRKLIKKHGIYIESGRCFGIKYHEAKGNLHAFIYDLLREVRRLEETTNE